MNMHGWLGSATVPDESEPVSLRNRLLERFHALRWYFLLVIAPTILVATYYGLVASNQFQSEAHFMVTSSGGSSSTSSGFGQLLGLTGGGQSQAQMLSVPDYLASHDAVSALAKEVDLPAIFRRPGVDVISRLSTSAPSPEKLLSYYKGKVSVHYDRDTGITTLKVRAFRPDDAYNLTSRLLVLGEERVNSMNKRSYSDAVQNAQMQLANAEAEVASVQRKLTQYRQSQRDIDPKTSGEAQIRLVSDLNARLAAARTQLQTMGSMISHSSPQYVALSREIASLEAEATSQSGELTGQGKNIANSLGGYEDLQVRQEFSAKQYDAAAAALAKARDDAQRQQLYLVRIVNPNLPVKSLFPERFKIIATIFLSLSVAYGIGWLILAGVREHAA